MWWKKLFPEVPLKRWQWLALFAVIVIGKWLWLFFDGVHVHPDSINYLKTTYHTDYPALYPLFLRFTTAVSSGLFFTAILQGALFGAGGILLVRVLAATPRAALLLTLALAIEPMSSFLATSIMSEGVFLPLLLVWVSSVLVLPRTNNAWWLVAFIGVLSGVMYGLRFAMLFPVVFLVIYWIFAHTMWRQRWQRLGLFLLCFQLILLPLRWQNSRIFGTTAINGFTGANVWNNTAFLYPDSRLAEAPRTDLEEHLQSFPDSVFDQERSIHARHLWDPGSPFRQFADQNYVFEQRWQAAEEAGQVGQELLINHPIRYFTEFAVPNFVKLFQETEVIDMRPYESWLATEYGVGQENMLFNYRPRYWWGLCSILVLLSLQVAFRKRMRRRRLIFLLGLLWWCTLIIPLVAPVNLRYYYTLAPLIWILAVQAIASKAMD